MIGARRAPRRATVGAAVALLAVALVVGPPAGAVDTTSPGSPQGNVTPTLQPTTGVAVVAQSAPVDGKIALVLHNGTTKPVRVDLVTAVATRTDGGLAVRARTAKAYPQVLAPDQLALASVTYRKKSLVAGRHDHGQGAQHARCRRRARSACVSVGDLVLSAPMTGAVAQTMGATVTNATTNWTARLPEVAVVCFGEASTPTTFASARASTRRIAPGKSRVGDGAAHVALPHVPGRRPSVLTFRPWRSSSGSWWWAVVIAIAAFFVTREATRIAKQPPPALYHLDDALAWVVDHLPDDVAATLTVDDVRRILEFQVEFFKRKGVSANGSDRLPGGTGRDRRVGDRRLRARALRGHRRELPPRAGVRRDRHAIELLARHRCRRVLRPSPARARVLTEISPAPTAFRGTSFRTRERRWSNTCMINMGPWRCAAAEAAVIL